jgi:hypothetical protein
MILRWNKQRTRGYANLETVRNLYQSGKVKSADGLPVPMEPERGHVHRIGTEQEPVVIEKVNRSGGTVVFVPLPYDLAKSVHEGKQTQTGDGGLVIHER